jgi:hypothetical protein
MKKSCDLSIDQKALRNAEHKKVYLMGSERQPGVMRAQKREIHLSRVKKNLIISVNSANFFFFFIFSEFFDF